MSKKSLKTFALLASFLCVIGGILVILSTFLKSTDEDILWIGIGIYFIGKGFFVGPMIFSNIFKN